MQDKYVQEAWHIYHELLEDEAQGKQDLGFSIREIKQEIAIHIIARCIELSEKYQSNEV